MRTGRWLAALEGFGPSRERMAGIDLVEDRAEAARGLLPGAEIRAGCASSLSWPDCSFDLAIATLKRR